MATTNEARGTTPDLTRWAVIAALAVFVVIGLRTVASPEVWNHLADGRAIIQEGALRTDTASFSVEGQRWINPNWLYDVLLYLAWSIGGATLTILLHLGLALGAFLLLLPHARRFAGDIPTALALMLCAWVMAPVLEVSPAIATLIFPALFIVVFNSKMKPTAGVTTLLVMQAAWTNLAPTFVWGPVICLVFAAQRYYTNTRKDKTLAGALNFNQQLLLAGAAAIATLLNPYFLGLHAFVLDSFRNPAALYSMSWVGLFSSQMQSSSLRFLIIAAFVIGACGVVLRKDKLPIALTTLAILSAFTAIRVAPLIGFFALLAFPFLALSLHGILIGQKRISTKPAPFEGVPGVALTGLLTLLSIYYFATNSYYVRHGHPGAFGLGLAHAGFPTREAIDLLEEHNVPTPMINLPQDGGYLRWMRRDNQVFADNRQNLYGEEFYRRMGLGLSGIDWQSFVARWQPASIFLNTTYRQTGRVAENLLAQRWAMIYMDGLTAIYVPRSAANAALVNNAELQQAGVARLMSALDHYNARLGGLVKPPIPANLIGAAGLMMANRKFEHAANIYSSLTRGVPRMTGAWFNLGICLVELHRPEEAVAALEQARRLSPKDALTWLWLGKAHEKAGNEDLAANAFSMCEQLSPDLYKAYRNITE